MATYDRENRELPAIDPRRPIAGYVEHAANNPGGIHGYDIAIGAYARHRTLKQDKKVAPPERVQRGLAGGVNSPLPAYCKTALLLCVDYAAVYGSDGINMPGCGFYEMHIRIPCLRSLRERWA